MRLADLAREIAVRVIQWIQLGLVGGVPQVLTDETALKHLTAVFKAELDAALAELRAQVTVLRDADAKFRHSPSYLGRVDAYNAVLALLVPTVEDEELRQIRALP